MSIVHIHIERTGGVKIQELYERVYGGDQMIWYSVRDGLFAPFSIKVANYTTKMQIILYTFISTRIDFVRSIMLFIRTHKRKKKSINKNGLVNSKIIIGHFSYEDLVNFLPPDKHHYRTVLREPLERMYSHYLYWRMHKGNVGHRKSPKYHEGITFEEFAFLPELKNYQTQAVGNDLSKYQHVGVVDNLFKFAKKLDLESFWNESKINKFTKEIPLFSEDFILRFKDFHSEDYSLYKQALLINSR